MRYGCEKVSMEVAANTEGIFEVLLCFQVSVMNSVNRDIQVIHLDKGGDIRQDFHFTFDPFLANLSKLRSFYSMKHL